MLWRDHLILCDMQILDEVMKFRWRPSPPVIIQQKYLSSLNAVHVTLSFCQLLREDRSGLEILIDASSADY